MADERTVTPRAFVLAAALAAVGALERLLLARVYGPISFGDTQTYFRLADVLSQASINAYDATRVPGYPLFLALLGRDDVQVMTAQLALGVISSLMLYFIMFRLTRSTSLAFVLGMAYNLIPSQLLFEFNLLSESLTTFLLLLTLASFVILIRMRQAPSIYAVAAGVGIAASLTGMVRTLFFILPVVLLPFILWHGRDWAQRIRLGLAFSVGPALMLGGWILFVYSHYGMVSPTTMGGYHMVQHTGAFFEYLPDEEATIRDLYIEYRDEQIAARRTQANAIWDAIPALSERTGLNFFELSAKLQRLSYDLIRGHPLLYMRSVAEGWIGFWKAPVYWRQDLLPSGLAIGLGALAWAGRLVSIAANGLFLALVALSLVHRKLYRRLAPSTPILLMSSLVLLASVAQTLVDHGDNPRFLVPMQMLVLLVVIWSGWSARRIPQEASSLGD